MKDRHVWEVVQHRNCENRFDFFQAPIIFFSIFYFVLFSLVSFYFVDFVSFRFVFVDFVSFRFVFVDFVSFRFVSISFRTLQVPSVFGNGYSEVQLSMCCYIVFVFCFFCLFVFLSSYSQDFINSLTSPPDQGVTGVFKNKFCD